MPMHETDSRTDDKTAVGLIYVCVHECLRE